MKEEIKCSIGKLNDAFAKLREGAEVASKELEKDGVIQRFEFTFELFWKTLKLFLKEEGISTYTPKEILKEAFRMGLLKEEEPFLNMLEDRNKTSHIYKKETADKIFKRIKENYISAMEAAIKKLNT